MFRFMTPLNRVLTFSLAIILFFPEQTQAQRVIVRGQVKEAGTGETLPGVNVVIKGTNIGTVTDIDGRYTIEISEPTNSMLIFSYVGYVTQEMAVNNQTTIDITLEEDIDILQEIVVIGYGTVRKSDLTGSVSSIRGKDLGKVTSSNPMQSLQGKVPGVQVSSASGAPGSSVIVRIRGQGTFNVAAPIYVVDGVIVQDIDFLNSADIESVDILKDASATAIYGSRGANGVVMITTKKGKLGEPVISFNAEYSIQKLEKKIDLLNGREFAIVANQIKSGSYNNVDLVPDTDWQDLIFDIAPMQHYQISASGASEKTSYYIGMGYFNQEGIITKSNYERVTLKLNNSYNITNFIKIGNNIAVTPYKRQNTNGNAVFVAYRAWPTLEPFQPDGTYTPVPGVGNVLADIEYTNSFDNGLRTVGNFYGDVDFLKGIKFRSSFGVDIDNVKSKRFTPIYFVNSQQENSTDDLTKNYFFKTDWLWENTLSFNNETGPHYVDAVIGFTMQESSSEQVTLVGENLLRPDQDFWYINPNNINPNGILNGVNDDLNFSMISYLARFNYTLKDKYLFTATFRRDGSSKFTKENKYANFPSFAVGWNLINENFLREIPFLSNLKLRASWGIVGNEKIRYSSQFSLISNGLNAVFGTEDVQYPGSSYGISGNSGIKWENTHQTDIGFEFGFFGDQLIGELDYYNKRTKDILIPLLVPGYFGNGDGATIFFNAGEVVNKGLEYILAFRGETSSINYRIGTNGTTIHNETVKVRGTGGSDDELGGFANGQVTRSAPGLPIGAFYGYIVDGIFQNSAELNSYPHLNNTGVGDLRYRDVNADGVLNGDDRTMIGSPIPDFVYGLNLEVGYKGVELSIDFQGQAGNEIYNNKETVRPDLYNFEQRYFNYWTGDGSTNTDPRPSSGGVNFNNPSSHFIYNGSFFRLRSLTLAYNFPTSLISRARIQSAKVYFSGTNVFTISDYTGYSPEVSSEIVNLNGIDFGGYPVSQIFSIGLNVNF